MANYSSDSEPLLLVQDTNGGTSDDSPNLVLNTDNLDKVLRRVGNRPVSVFTVIGPQKTGKSLVLGYMVKYLTAAEKDDAEWINWKNKTKPMEEIKWPQKGTSPNTSGIWCYSRPFIFEDDSQNGEEVAVLLLYTQSSENSKWSESRTSAALAGLSIRASSSTIFNISKELDEKCILALSTYTANAMLGFEKSEGNRLQPLAPFQNALMLIRDWSFPTEYHYGFSGGREYVKVEKLQQQICQSGEARQSRQIITSCFENVSACLLPYPGNEVLKSSFKGSIQEMDIQFVECLRDFINDTIDVDKLPLKRNPVGSTISGVEWKQLLEKYIEAVNFGNQEGVNQTKLVKYLGIKHTVLPGEEKKYMKFALQIYGKNWNKKLGKDVDKVFTEKEFDEFHRSAKKRALKAFKEEMLQEGDDSGDDDVDENLLKLFKKAEKQLKDMLDARFKENLEERKALQLATLAKFKDELIRQYKEAMNRAFPADVKIPSEKMVRNESLANMEDSKQRFRLKIGGAPNETTNKIFEALTRELKEAEEKITAKILRKEQSKGESAHSFISVAKPAVRLLPERQTSYMAANVETEKPVSKSTISSFSITEAKPQVSTSKSLNDDSRKKSEKTDRVTRTTREQKRLEEERLKERAKQLVNRLREDYISDLNRQLEEDNVNLETYHNQHLDKIMQKFRNETAFEPASQEFKLYSELLEDDLKMALSKAKSKQRQASKSKQSQTEKLVNQAIYKYEENLDQYLIDHQDLPQDQFERVHKKILNAELDFLEESLSSKEYSKAKIQVEDETRKIFEKLKLKNERGRNINLNKSKQLVNDLVAEHRDKLNRAMKLASNEKALSKEHENLKTKIIEKLRLACSTDKSKFQEHLQNLETGLNQNYSEISIKFKRTLENESGNQKIATHQARQFYKEEMDKQFKNHEFILETELLKIHKRISAEALKKCPKNLEASQLREFETAIQAMFKMYQDENNMNMNIEPAIGIDLGTTFSCVAVYQKGEVKIVPNSDGKLTTPSYVSISSSGKEIVGHSAKERAYENPEGTIFDAKRILGRRFDDPKLQEDMKLWPFTVVDGGRGVPMIEINGKKLNPEEISAKVLTQLKKDAEVYLKRSVTKAVITVPAYFTDGQKQATIDAGTMAGLEVLSILTEPVAAAMAYRLQYVTGEREGGSGERHILIFDLGGGTFDVAILKTCQGNIEVLTVDGDTHLGGEDFDKNLMDYCAAEFKRENKIDLFEGKDSLKKSVKDNVRRTLKRLQAECERQKIVLASARSAVVNLDNIYKDKDLRVTISRTQFEKINEKLFQTTIKVVEKSLKMAKLKKEQIDDIVLVGGSTRIPKIQQLLRDFFNGKELDKKINPDEAVAHGAGLVAAIKKGNLGKENAAFTRIQDVTPMPIGVEVYGGGFSPIIPKSTKIPVKLQERYKTAHNNQTSVQITIYEGEDPVAVKNKHLGDFYLNGIPPKGAGEENIDVEMVINDQGILHVTASVSSTGRKNAVTVTENKQRMGQAAIRRYIADKASRGK